MDLFVLKKKEKFLLGEFGVSHVNNGESIVAVGARIFANSSIE